MGIRKEMQRTWKVYRMLGTALVTAICLAGPWAGTALADEDSERITSIHLNIESDITAGSYDCDVDVDTDDDEYSVGGAEITNGDGEWGGGETPRLEIVLYAEDGYYFGGSGKSMFSFSGSDADYVSSRREDDNTTLIVIVDLEELDGEDLEIGDAWWDGSYGTAAWEEVSGASYYQIRLYRDGSSIASADRIYDNSYEFDSKITKSGDYYFEVRAVGSGSAKGDWERSNTWEVDEDDAEELSSRDYYSSGSKYSDKDEDDDEDDSYNDKLADSSDDSDSKTNVYASDQSDTTGPGAESSGRTSSASSSSRTSSASSSGTSSGSSSDQDKTRVTSASYSRSSVNTEDENEWKRDDSGWWFRFSDGSYPFNCWQMIDGKWYFFDGNGYLKYGWISSSEKWYYCGDDGAMVVNAKTPDGYYVGGDGAWIQ